MANKSVLQFKEVSAISGANLFHLVVGNVDKKIQWTNVVAQVDTDLSISTTFTSINSSISTINGNITTINSSLSTLAGNISTVDAGAVHKTGNETVDGVKTFSSSPTAPTPTVGDSSTNVATTAFVTTAIAGLGIGDVSSTVNLTSGYYPVANGNKTITNGRIYQDASQLRINSPTTSNYGIIGNVESALYSTTMFGTSKVGVSDINSVFSYVGSTTVGSIVIDNSGLLISSNSSLNLICNVVRLNNLTGNRVLTLDSSKNIVATAVLPLEYGGTGASAKPGVGALPYMSTATAYGYDKDNYSYDSTTKTLNLNNIFVTPDDGITGVNIEGASNLLRLVTTDAGFDAVIVEALGNGIKVDSASGTAGRFTSSENPGEFNQTGALSADVDYEGVVINRMFTRPASGAGSSAKATGPMLLINDATGSLGTGDLIRLQKQNVNRFRVTSAGKIVYTDGTQAANTYMVDDGTGSGIATWARVASFPMPSMTYANTSTISTDTDIFTGVMPGNTLVSNKDKLVYDFVIGNTGGISGDVSYQVKVNGAALVAPLTVTLNTTSDPITLRITIERISSSSFNFFLQYYFGTHTTSLRTVYFNTVTGFDFTTNSTLTVVANQLLTTRIISGLEGHGVYYKTV